MRDQLSMRIALVCGHDASEAEAVVIRPTGRVKFDCPHGCGLQATA